MYPRQHLNTHMSILMYNAFSFLPVTCARPRLTVIVTAASVWTVTEIGNAGTHAAETGTESPGKGGGDQGGKKQEKDWLILKPSS